MKENRARHVETESKKDEAVSISLWIDSYSDIFSDFDPRPFDERALSDDFIAQVRKVSKETRGRINIFKLLVPDGMRKEEYEKIIRKRIEIYFYNTHQQLQAEKRSVKIKGIYFTVCGIALMIIASYISFLKPSSFYVNLVLVLTEPGGWFLFWTGLDHLISFSKSKKSEMDFYSRMSSTHVEFSSYK